MWCSTSLTVTKRICVPVSSYSTEPAVRISNPFRFMSALSLGVPSNLSHQPCCEPLALFFANQALFFSFHSRKYCVIWTEDCDSRVETQRWGSLALSLARSSAVSLPLILLYTGIQSNSTVRSLVSLSSLL